MESGNIAWVLVSAAMVLFMTPGLAFFYGGMDRGRNVLNMLMMNFYCVLVVPILWVVVGYSLSQSPFENDFIGGFDNAFLNDIGILGEDAGGTLAIVAFLGMFAAITPALISGAVADRMKFSAWAIFVPVWSLFVYVPVFKWVYGGWLGQRGSIDSCRNCMSKVTQTHSSQLPATTATDHSPADQWHCSGPWWSLVPRSE